MTIPTGGSGSKRCPKCGEDKPHGDFYKRTASSDGLQGWCKGCLGNGVNSYRRTWRRGHPEERLVERYAYRAKKNGLPFSLTVDDIRIPEYCPACGVKLASRVGSKGPCKTSPSLDKYDPAKGYVPGNVWVICFTCNRRKQDMTGEQMIEFGTRIMEAWAA